MRFSGSSAAAAAAGGRQGRHAGPSGGWGAYRCAGGAASRRGAVSWAARLALLPAAARPAAPTGEQAVPSGVRGGESALGAAARPGRGPGARRRLQLTGVSGAPG
jgi:hypothetical protein